MNPELLNADWRVEVDLCRGVQRTYFLHLRYSNAHSPQLDLFLDLRDDPKHILAARHYRYVSDALRRIHPEMSTVQIEAHPSFQTAMTQLCAFHLEVLRTPVFKTLFQVLKSCTRNDP